jgi:PPOX class probable F420-dependent enzyme
MAKIDFDSDLGKRALKRLENEQVVWLTTTSPSGTPLPTPVWFLWHEDTVLIFSQPNTPKVKAIEKSGTVSLNFNSTEHGGDIVVISGVAERLKGGPPATDYPDYIEKYAEGLTSLGMTAEGFAASYSEHLRVVPHQMRGF